ncbi:MAG: PD-(D/E)XK nuclease family protein [Bifidobacteriaceae bacterium]|jgi:superfamily I DNA/RNA helicase/RecB family exonuclease|nr:PD-(D/E)XK nuclease family protein [Bifidobacteriaceae bacterium]
METDRPALELDLTPPPLGRVVPDQTQEEALALIAQGGPVSVFGFPGTGKTLVAELAASAALGAGLGGGFPGDSQERQRGLGRGGRQVVVVSSDRHAAAALSARIVRRAGAVVEGRPAVTPTSLAMTILERRARAVAALPLEFALEASAEYQPQMVTGAEQAAALTTLLGLDGGPAAPGVDWPDRIPPAALGLAAFRNELRDLLMRAAERGLDPFGLDCLGQDYGRPEWRAAAQFYQRYLDTLDMRNTADAGLKLDAAAMVAQAYLCLRDWSKPFEVRGQTVQLDPALRPNWDLVIVDDYQEASLALHRLVVELSTLGTQVVCLGSPDTAAQSFRGAIPGALAESTLPAPAGWQAREVVLAKCWRQSGDLFQCSAGVVGRLRPGGRSRRAGALPTAAAAVPGQVRAVVVGSQAEVAAAIARRFREAHAGQGLPWNKMAVLTRTAGQVALLRSLLTSAGLPVRVPGSEVLATDHPAVAPLVEVLRCSAGPEGLTPAVAARLAGSSVGGLDAADLRELRRSLGRAAGRAGAVAAPDELLARLLAADGPELGGPAAGSPEEEGPEAGVQAAGGTANDGPAGGGMGDRGAWAGSADSDWLESAVPERLRPALGRLRAAIKAGKVAAARHGASAAAVLWAIWQATGLSELWSGWALAGGPRGTRADGDLDAVLALFAAAGRHDARKPGSGPAGFVSYLKAQELPSDTIAAHAPEGDRMIVSTATAGIGREWDLVALVGLQEDVWPDLRLRDTLLGAGRLADIVDGKDAAPSGAQRRREVLEDETRTFALALTRAKREVLAVAVANTDEQPSRFFRWLAESQGSSSMATPSQVGRAPDGGWIAGGPGWPFDLRGIVAEARAALTGLVPPTPPGREAPLGQRALAGQGASALPEAPAVQDSAVPDSPAVTGEAGRREAARVLAVLAAAGIDGADPAGWPGLVSPSVSARLYPPASAPVLTPSKVDSLSRCPLLWALNKAGGSREGGDRASLGTLIHWLAEQYPRAGPEELRERLEEQWPELGLADNYSGRRLKAEALEMAARLGVYQRAHPGLVANEAEIMVAPGPGATALPVRLAGRIDRLEEAGDGKVRVVDFKTGKTAITAAEAAANPQLGSYQLAINAGLVPPHAAASEAVLVYLSRGARGPAELRQAALSGSEDPNWMITLLERCAEDAAGPGFEARPGPHCHSCAVKSSCPALPEGRQVIA